MIRKLFISFFTILNLSALHAEPSDEVHWERSKIFLDQQIGVLEQKSQKLQREFDPITTEYREASKIRIFNSAAIFAAALPMAGILIYAMTHRIFKGQISGLDAGGRVIGAIITLGLTGSLFKRLFGGAPQFSEIKFSQENDVRELIWKPLHFRYALIKPDELLRDSELRVGNFADRVTAYMERIIPTISRGMSLPDYHRLTDHLNHFWMSVDSEVIPAMKRAQAEVLNAMDTESTRHSIVEAATNYWMKKTELDLAQANLAATQRLRASVEDKICKKSFHGMSQQGS